MKNPAAIFAALCIGGCCNYATTTTVCHVVELANRHPIQGAMVWEQPYSPIHPFWPRGDGGVTDLHGEVKLKTPTDFWFYSSSVKADGYFEPSQGEVDKFHYPHPADNSWIFYMKRVASTCPTR